MRRGSIRIPSFQRGFVWSDAQIVGLLQSLIAGHFVGSVIVWHKYATRPWSGTVGELAVSSPIVDSTLARDALLVVDGQQRLGSIATAVASPRFEFDLTSGRVVVSAEPGGRMMMPMRFGLERPSTLHVSAWCKSHAATHGLDDDELFHVVTHAIDMIKSARLAYVDLPHDWSAERVIETFRKINSTGTPIEPDELRSLLERAAEDVE